ncbi:hypothetical protein MMC25_002109 [Agyrium rufum]|nr:hypothetical protein [Agyrium rufum]
MVGEGANVSTDHLETLSIGISHGHVDVGVGVGDSTATPTAALLLTILQESTGRIATILFAHKLGTALEPECKMYRLAADVFNDAAMIFDCLSPALPRGPRTVLLSASSVLRALCGVAAGSAKASLSAHFARWGNLGELNAKDSSQETIISLLGMLAGSVVVSYVSSPLATWSLLIVLLSIHLAMNHAAVRAVSMNTLNRQRANIVFSHLWETGETLSLKQTSGKERIFERDGALRWKGGHLLAFAGIGSPLQRLLDLVSQSISTSSKVVDSTMDAAMALQRILGLFEKEEFLIWCLPSTDHSLARFCIVLKENASPLSQLKGWACSIRAARDLEHSDSQHQNPEEMLKIVQTAVAAINSRWIADVTKLREAGWDLDMSSLETGSSFRINLGEGKKQM